MYNEEEKTSDVKSEHIPGMLNRCATNGRYGVWGHDIDDLILHSADYNPKTGEVFPGCDS